MSESTTVLLAGGGTGGHIFPNAAVLERLHESGAEVRGDIRGHFVLSRRALDGQIAAKLGVAYTGIAAEPFGVRPGALWRFARGFRAGKREVAELIERSGARVMVATGGFVSGPAVRAAREAGVVVALVNLDAVPGRANAWLAGQVDKVFSVYAHRSLPGAERIGLPLRRAAVRADVTQDDAREGLGLSRARRTLLVTAGSQGAVSVNRAMMALCDRPAVREALRQRWQVLHLAGEKQREEVASAYEAAGVSATVLAFCDQMGLAWRAADLAVTRAGAGSVAEAWANRVPSVFLPYPYHKDEHQRLNAQPMADAGGAVVVRDAVEPAANVAALAPLLEPLLADDAKRAAMREALDRDPPPDGADAVTAWIRATPAFRAL
ncbi:MAG: glycosyltransferase [Phycisphaeraceae bacterium]